MLTTATPPRKFEATPPKAYNPVTFAHGLLKNTTLVWNEYDSLLCPSCVLPSLVIYIVNPSTFLRD